MAPVIATKKLTKRFDKLTAVDSVDLTIERGEIFGLLGPNGAGKTTIINMLCTLLAPSGGTASVDGHDVVKAPELVRQSIGIVFQEQSLDTTLTARENLELHARLYAVPKGIRAARITELLALVNLQDRADDICRTFSGGMRRRLELIRGLLHRPAVLFLDEPTTGLDPQTRTRMWEYIRKIARDNGTTVILTTHYMDEADLICDRIGIIDHGKIVSLGTPTELKDALGGNLIRVRAPSIDRQALEALPFVRKVIVDDGAATISVENVERNLPQLLAHLPQLESIQIRTMTLNDVFISHTGRAIRDDDPGEGAVDAWIRNMVQGDPK